MDAAVSQSSSSSIPLQKKRFRRSPERFGDAGMLELSISIEDEHDFSDNSFDDITFVPPQENVQPKVVATVKKIVQPNPKKKIRMDGSKSINHRSDDLQTDNLDLSLLDFNADFDELESTTTKESSSRNIAVGCGNDKTENVEIASGTASVIKSADEMNQNESYNDLFILCQTILKEFKGLKECSKETLARVSIIEDVMLKSGSLGNMNHKSTLTKNIEEIRVFEMNNHLPLKHMNHVKSFEESLDNPDFMEAAVIDRKFHCHVSVLLQSNYRFCI